ncbi:aspartic peptidase A1 [Gloeopeniophorella convolvens]|nr:aspartic peptidase A1 [Gloeopeniophorella convolvens]
MQLVSPFIALLGSLLALSVLQANAIPLAPEQIGIVTLPLKRIAMRQDLHPQVNLQRHINRSHRRLARMTGREEPSSELLLERLTKRKAHIDGSGSARIGYAGAKLGLAKGPPEVSTNAQEKPAANQANVFAVGQDGNDGFSSVDAQALADNTLTPANTPTDSDSLGLDIEENDVGYIATVQMGTPPRDFKLLMDSGSADLWVGAEGCVSASGGDCGNHVFLGSQSSSSFVDTQKSFQVTYGTGAVAGDIITDNLAFAGLQLPGHVFGVATEESLDFSSDQTTFDGLMGLAQSLLSQQQTPTPVEALASAGLIKEAITSYKISRLADEKNDGEVTFGGLDTSKFDQTTLATLPNVNTQGFWEGALDDVSVNGQDLGLQGRTAILDTGTTLMIAPPADAAAIHQQIPGSQSDGQGGFTVPCTNNATVTLTFGGQNFDIDPRDIAFSPIDPNDPTGDCASGISSGEQNGANEWLVGDVFLKNAYFSTDVGRNTIQLAKLV